MGLKSWLHAKRHQKSPPSEAGLFELHKYEVDGEFDYQSYRASQIHKAKSDTGDVWADPKTLDLIAEYAQTHLSSSSFLLCHGSKSGMESDYLAKKLGCDGLGTDISPPNAAKGVVEWDFHERCDDWVGRASLIYTNALDHSYDPKKALDTWVDQLAPGGLIFVEHTMLHGPAGAGASDPFGAHPLIMPYLVLTWGQGAYFVRDLIKAPHRKPHWKPTDGVRQNTDLDIWIFVIGRSG